MNRYSVFLKLLGYALGSVVMYWGVAMLFVAFWFFTGLLIWLLIWLWNKVTGHNHSWEWGLNWLDGISKAIHHYQLEWLGWMPGLFIQIWYGGYVAHLVRTSTLESGTGYTIAVHVTGLLGVVIAAIVFYWLYEQLIEVNLGSWIYLVVGSLPLSAYTWFLAQPQVAAPLSKSWAWCFNIFLTKFIESL